MRRNLIVVAVMTTPILASAVLPATANSAVRQATANSGARASLGIAAQVLSVSCAPDGNCAAGGIYYDASAPDSQAFVLTERNGQWGAPIEVPGLAPLLPNNSIVKSVSCAPGGCVAGGSYQSPSGKLSYAFVTNEKNGRWSPLVTIAGASTAASAFSWVGSVSCSGPGNCAAGGFPAFVVSEVNGRWGRAYHFAAGKNGRVKVSCASAGNCTAGWKTFVASERNGHWGRPIAVPGLRALGTGAGIASLSCTAAADCAVGGLYNKIFAGESVFVASERNGRWGKALELPGFTSMLNQTGFADFAAVSCYSAGNCVTGGSYGFPAGFAGGVLEPFVAAERNGRWGNARRVPGTLPPDATICQPSGGPCVSGAVLSVWCAPGGPCAAGGVGNTTSTSAAPAFVAMYKNGRWIKATEIPGPAANDSAVQSVSCTRAGKCVAGGVGFVADENNGTWGQAHPVS